MRSIVLTEPFGVSVATTRAPEPGPGQALLKMVYGGICGSDLASYRGVSAYVSYPRTLGHEFSAEIVQVGPNDSGLEAGMLVTGLPYFNCGTCRACRLGYRNACIRNETMGVQRDGAFSTTFTLDTDRIYDGSGIDPRALALIEPFSISHHGIAQAQLAEQDRVLVLGAGAIGILAAVAAKSRGARAYIADLSPQKVASAVSTFGLDGGLDSSDPVAFVDQVHQLTDGDGFDVTVEAAGAAAAFAACVEHVASLGRVIVIGVSTQSALFNATALQRKEIAIIGSRGATPEDFAATMALARDGFVDLTQLIMFESPAGQAAAAFARLDRDSAAVTKALLRF